MTTATTLHNGSIIDTPSLVPDKRRWPVGAEIVSPGRTSFRVWAPKRKGVEVVTEGADAALYPLEPEADGYFSATLPVGAGTRYRLRLNGKQSFPDPASRFQPDGPHGPSEVIDPSTFAWQTEWPGVDVHRLIISEIHIGTFTAEGTWQAAIEQLPRLADVGINLLEVMPVADFTGDFGWGYDGVNLFAPTRLYGRPDSFRQFIDRAHALGIGVILDVVYNHLGPDGNYLGQFTKDYFSKRHHTDWGDAINFDGENSAPVREYFLMNAAYWIDEYRLDGLRLDATQNIYDDSPVERGGEHILAGISRVAREAAGQRSIVLVAENEPQETTLLRSCEEGGYGLDMAWNDDIHHSMRVALTGRAEAYYSDHRGRPQEMISAAKYGYLFQGQYYMWQRRGRGMPGLNLPPSAFVSFLDNHDQIANSGAGLRCHQLTNPGHFRAMTAYVMLAPATPMLFQGQEFASSSPFFYFADHKPELAAKVRDGRIEFLKQFPSLADAEVSPQIPDPHERETFERCKLDPQEATRNAGAVKMHRDLIALRRSEPFATRRPHGVDGAVLGDEAFVLRFFGEEPLQDRLLVINLGVDLECHPMPEPLLAPPLGRGCAQLWSSEDRNYGGGGSGGFRLQGTWVIPGSSATVLHPGDPWPIPSEDD